MSAPVLIRHLKGNKQTVTAIAFNPTSEQFAAGSLDRTIAIYSTKQKNIRCLKFDLDQEIYDIDWGRKNLLALVGKDRCINVFEPVVHSGYSETIVAGQSSIRSVHFSASGNRLITGSDDKSIKMWRLSHRNFISSYTGHTNWVRCARFSPNNKMIASCSDDKTMKVWDVSTGECIHTFKDEKGHGLQVCWHHDNNLIAIAQQNARVKIFDLKMRKLIQYYRIYDGEVHCLDFHPSGKFMVTGSSDGLTKVIDLLEGRDVYTLKGHSDAVTSVKFSYDGNYFVTGSKDKHIMVWKSNIAQSNPNDHDASLEGTPGKIDNKENHEDSTKCPSISVDARSFENYLQNDDVEL